MRFLVVFMLALLAQLSFGRTVSAPVVVDLALSPASVIGGNSSTATVTISEPAPAGGAEVAIYSSTPTVAGVPASVVIPEGETSVSFQVVTSPVTATGGVMITATYGGAGASAMLTITPSTTVDQVGIIKVQYDSRKGGQLKVEAVSSSPTAKLSVLKTSTGALIGNLTRGKNGRYTGTFTVGSNPNTITIVSDQGGSITVNIGR
jgi:hypothetical protein